MSERIVISIVCVDRPGVATAVARWLFGRGCNLAETTFAALGGSAELTLMCEPPAGLDAATLAAGIHALPELAGARVTVAPAASGAARPITHRLEVVGPDRPGLLLTLLEAFEAQGIGVVRINSQPFGEPPERRHAIRFALSLDADAERALAEIAATARGLGLEVRLPAV